MVMPYELRLWLSGLPWWLLPLETLESHPMQSVRVPRLAVLFL